MSVNNLVTLTTKIKTWAVSKFAIIAHNHDSSYEAKNANIQAHIFSVSNPHAVTKSQVGLADVTNDKQIKAAASSVNGSVPVWSGTGGDLLGGGYGVETTLTNTSTNFAVSSAVYTALQNAIAEMGGALLEGVNGLSDLKALDTTSATSYPDKALICVESSGLYRLDRDSEQTANEPFVVAPTTGVGRWFLMATSTSDHKLLAGLQGGTTNEYFHLTQAQYGALPSGISSTNQLVALDNTKLSHLSTSDGTLDSDYLVVSAATWTAIDALLV